MIVRVVEHDDVGEHPFAQQSAIAQPESRRDAARHLPHRILEREQLLLAHVAAEDARIGAVRARMHDALRAVRVVRRPRPCR